MDAADHLNSQFEAHAETVAATLDAVRGPFAELVFACVSSVGGGGKIMLMGNGGSAADAQHLATELVVRYVTDRPAIAALALTTDTSLLTAAANDLGYETIFARQVEALASPQDIVIGISTSGNSENVVQALATAKGIGATTVAFTGQSGGKMAGLADVLVAVPSTVTARIQEMHILIGHALCGAIEIGLGLTPDEG